MQPFSRIAGPTYFLILTESMNPQHLLYHAPDGELFIHDGKVGAQLCFLQLEEVSAQAIRRLNPDILPVTIAPVHPESERPPIRLVFKHERAAETADWLSLVLAGARAKTYPR